MQHCLEINDNQFEKEVIKCEKVVLADFWAPWCGPCKEIAPTLEEIALHYKGVIKIVKINVDDNQEISKKFNIRGIPTIMIFKEGEHVETKVGVINKSDLINILDKYI